MYLVVPFAITLVGLDEGGREAGVGVGEEASGCRRGGRGRGRGSRGRRSGRGSEGGRVVAPPNSISTGIVDWPR